jgi:hypothetical protein
MSLKSLWLLGQKICKMLIIKKMASAEFYIDQWTERFLFRLNEFINFSTDRKNE